MSLFKKNKLIASSFAISAFFNVSAISAQTDPIVFLDQGTEWSQQERSKFYTQDQGSRIMPLAWMKALKRSDGSEFLSEGLTEFGYLSNPDTPGIPVGFSVADFEGKPSIGMTCAACHTRQIDVDGTLYRIDGGPAIVDFQRLLLAIDTAFGNVMSDDAVFEAFSTEVLGPSHTEVQKQTLKIKASTWYLRYHTLIERALPTPSWGPSRLDAVSMIFNRLAGLDIGEPPTYLIPENIARADAPARYPFLWNAARQDYTQWPGFSKNGKSWESSWWYCT